MLTQAALDAGKTIHVCFPLFSNDKDQQIANLPASLSRFVWDVAQAEQLALVGVSKASNHMN
jgi:hypothetical protein